MMLMHRLFTAPCMRRRKKGAGYGDAKRYWVTLHYLEHRGMGEVTDRGGALPIFQPPCHTGVSPQWNVTISDIGKLAESESELCIRGHIECICCESETKFGHAFICRSIIKQEKQFQVKPVQPKTGNYYVERKQLLCAKKQFLSRKSNY